MTTTKALPELPKAAAYIDQSGECSPSLNCDVYTADQMSAYARAALASASTEPPEIHPLIQGGALKIPAPSSTEPPKGEPVASDLKAIGYVKRDMGGCVCAFWTVEQVAATPAQIVADAEAEPVLLKSDVIAALAAAPRPATTSAVDEDLQAMYVPYPSGLHPATVELVSKLAFRLAIKLRKAEKKYGYSDGWRSDNWMEECQKALAEHVAKGDPLDVAAYCAFCMHHGWSTAAPQPTAPQAARDAANVKVTTQGVQFGGAWYSHERITGYTADQLNSGNCHVTGRAYMQWVYAAIAATKGDSSHE